MPAPRKQGFANFVKLMNEYEALPNALPPKKIDGYEPRWMTLDEHLLLENHKKECTAMKLFTPTVKVLLVGAVVGYGLGSLHGWSLAIAKK